MRVLPTLAVGIAMCLAAQHSTSAQTLDEIVARHLEARGGLDRLQAIRTVRIIARDPYEPVLDETLALVVIVEEKRPNLKRTTTLAPTLSAADYEEVVRNKKGDANPLAADQALVQYSPYRQAKTLSPLDTVTLRVAAFDGTSNWEWSQSGAEARKVPGNQPYDFGVEGPLVDYVAKGSRVELRGQATSRGKACFRLRVTSRQGDVRDVFVDARTFLEVAVEYQPQGASPGLQQTYDHWKRVEGVMVPHTITTIQNARKHVRRIDKVQFNVPIDDRRFAMPTAVR